MLTGVCHVWKLILFLTLPSHNHLRICISSQKKKRKGTLPIFFVRHTCCCMEQNDILIQESLVQILSLFLHSPLLCVKDKWAVNSWCVSVHVSVQVCICVSQMGGPDSAVFVVFVVLRAPGGCAHFKGPSELWGLETWDRTAQLAQRTRVHLENVSWAEELDQDELPQTSPLHSERPRCPMIAYQSETLRFTDWTQFTSKFTISDTNAVFNTLDLAVQV